MMSEFKCCCMILLANVMPVLLSGTSIAPKFVCPGDSVQLFQNIKLDNRNSFVSLAINGDRNTQIATWTVLNYTLNSTILPEYKDKVKLNTNGTILLENIHRWDEAKYIIKNQIDAMFLTDDVQIFVMDAPTKDCRPTIVQLGKSLIATLKHSDCGKPVATVYWKDCCGVSNSSEPVVKLTPGKEDCTCNACIESPALKCVKSSSPLDYCRTIFARGTYSPLIPLETSSESFIIVGIISGILVLLFITVAAILICRRKEAFVKRRDKEPKLLEAFAKRRDKEPKSLEAFVKRRDKEPKSLEEMHPLIEIKEIRAPIESDDPEHEMKKARLAYEVSTDLAASGKQQKTQYPLFPTGSNSPRFEYAIKITPNYISPNNNFY